MPPENVNPMTVPTQTTLGGPSPSGSDLSPTASMPATSGFYQAASPTASMGIGSAAGSLPPTTENLDSSSYMASPPGTYMVPPTGSSVQSVGTDFGSALCQTEYGIPIDPQALPADPRVIVDTNVSVQIQRDSPQRPIPQSAPAGLTLPPQAPAPRPPLQPQMMCTIAGLGS